MISVIVITKNEEQILKTCLESVKWADEILVCDNGSTDKTLDLAKKYTDKIFKFEEQDFASLRNKAIEKAQGDWILYVDADERVLEPLKEELLGISRSSDKSAYAISRINVIFGQKVDYGPYQKDWMIRFFKKDKFKSWIGKIHEYGTFNGELGYSQNSFLHLTHRNLDQVVLKSLDWSHFDADLKLEANHPKMSGWRFLRIFVTEIFNQGFRRKGFFGGDVGMIDSLLQVFSTYISYIRLWELQQPKPLNEVYRQVDRKLLESNFKSFS